MLADRSGVATQLLEIARGRSEGRRSERWALAGAGIGAVVSLPGLLPGSDGELFQQRLERTLGRPTWTGPEGAVWVVDASEDQGL